MFALQRYSPNHRFVYHYVEDPLTEPLRSIPFGVIVLDCTFLCWRWARPRRLFSDIVSETGEKSVVNRTFFKAILVVDSLSFMGHLLSNVSIQQKMTAAL
jgi:hypothetical protein